MAGAVACIAMHRLAHNVQLGQRVVKFHHLTNVLQEHDTKNSEESNGRIMRQKTVNYSTKTTQMVDSLSLSLSSLWAWMNRFE